MRPEWLRRFRRLLLVLYLASFVLPLGKGVGAAAFIVTLSFGFAVPVLLVMWAANPLFWFGLSDLRRGHHGRATILGILACVAALLPMLPFGGAPLGVIWNLPADSLPPFGYFAWLASIVGLTVVATAVWWARSRPRIHIATIMIAIAAIALPLAAWPLIGRVLGWSGSGGGFYCCSLDDSDSGRAGWSILPACGPRNGLRAGRM